MKEKKRKTQGERGREKGRERERERETKGRNDIASFVFASVAFASFPIASWDPSQKRNPRLPHHWAWGPSWDPRH